MATAIVWSSNNEKPSSFHFLIQTEDGNLRNVQVFVGPTKGMNIKVGKKKQKFPARRKKLRSYSKVEKLKKFFLSLFSYLVFTFRGIQFEFYETYLKVIKV